jgi:transposase
MLRRMEKRHLVKLTEGERAYLAEYISSGEGKARSLARARILLKADAGPHGPGRTDAEVAEAVEVSVPTVERARRDFAERGLEAALRPRPQPERPDKRVLDGEKEARLIAVACSAPPAGRERWTLRLLADKLVELEVVAAVSYETVRQILKKTSSSLGSRSGG